MVTDVVPLPDDSDDPPQGRLLGSDPRRMVVPEVPGRGRPLRWRNVDPQLTSHDWLYAICQGRVCFLLSLPSGADAGSILRGERRNPE